MRNTRKMLWASLRLAAGLTIGACVTSHRARVSEEGFARIPPEELAEVSELRAREAKATDELARSDVGIQSAKNDIDSAEQELKAANALLRQADAASKQAEYDRNEAGAKEATKAGQVSSARKLAAESWVRAAKAQLGYAQARKDAVEAERELIRSQIEIAKYDALRRSGDPEAANVKASDLYQRQEAAQKKLAEAKARTTELAGTAEQKRTVWSTDRDRYRSLEDTGGGGSQ